MKPLCNCRRHGGMPAAAGGERRRFLGSVAIAALAALAGCDGPGSGSSGGGTRAPREIEASTSCELDGMLLADYPGPKGQLFYADAAEPAFFCDTVELLNMLLRPEQVRKVAAAYVQDMGHADWDQPRGHWIDARAAFYVRGSRRNGSMGPTLATFSGEAEARAFAGQYGGTVLRFEDIKPEMVDLSGGAKFDQRM